MVYRGIQQEEVIWSIQVSNKRREYGVLTYPTRGGHMVYRRIQQEEVIWSIDVSNKRR